MKELPILILAILVFASAAASQEGLEYGDSMEYGAVYGEVGEIDTKALTIGVGEYDYEKEEEITVTYHMSEGVTLEGVDDIDEIEIGNWVDLEYYTDQEGRKIADYIAVEIEPFSEDTIEEIVQDTEEEVVIE